MLTFTNLRRLLLGPPLPPTPSTPPISPPDSPEPIPFPFLSLPLDIRLLIYSQISHNGPSAYPEKNALYALLFTNSQVRYEASSIFYSSSGPGMLFQSPSSCLSFMELTKPHLYLMTSLTIQVPNGDTYALERVWRKLVEGGVGVVRVVIDLQCRSSKVANMVPRKGLEKEVGGKALEWARARAQVLETRFERSMRGDKKKEVSEIHDDDEVEYKWPSYLGKMKSLRYIAIDGNPFDNWNVEFELAVLSLHERMFRVAMGMGEMQGNRDGKGIACYGRWGDWFWFGSHGVAGRSDMLNSLDPPLR